MSADHPADKIDDQWNRDAGNPDEVDDDTCMDHFCDGNIPRSIKDGIWRRRDWQHEAQRCRERNADRGPPNNPMVRRLWSKACSARFTARASLLILPKIIRLLYIMTVA